MTISKDAEETSTLDAPLTLICIQCAVERNWLIQNCEHLVLPRKEYRERHGWMEWERERCLKPAENNAFSA